MKIEAFIKSLKRADKIKLIKEPLMLKELVSETYPQIEINVSDIIITDA